MQVRRGGVGAMMALYYGEQNTDGMGKSVTYFVNALNASMVPTLTNCCSYAD